MNRWLMLRTEEIISPPAFVADDVQIARFARAIACDATPPLRLEVFASTTRHLPKQRGRKFVGCGAAS
jgi:hypothetical protein